MAATPLDHFVQAQILEMPAVPQVDVRVLVVRKPESFFDERSRGGMRAAFAPGLFAMYARIPEPAAQPGVEQGHDKSDDRGGIVSHVRTGRGARNRHGGAERKTPGV